MCSCDQLRRLLEDRDSPCQFPEHLAYHLRKSRCPKAIRTPPLQTKAENANTEGFRAVNSCLPAKKQPFRARGIATHALIKGGRANSEVFSQWRARGEGPTDV